MFANNDTIELTNQVQTLIKDSGPNTIMDNFDHEDIKEDHLEPTLIYKGMGVHPGSLKESPP